MALYLALGCTEKVRIKGRQKTGPAPLPCPPAPQPPARPGFPRRLASSPLSRPPLPGASSGSRAPPGGLAGSSPGGGSAPPPRTSTHSTAALCAEFSAPKLCSPQSSRKPGSVAFKDAEDKTLYNNLKQIFFCIQEQRDIGSSKHQVPFTKPCQYEMQRATGEQHPVPAINNESEEPEASKILPLPCL
nr:vegetative cell wall protein gp1-like [Marmota flaviventris]